MGEYTGRIEIDRPAAEVFAFLSDIRNMPRYLPTVRQVTAEGTNRVAVEGEAEGHAYRDEGSLRVLAEARRMEWSADKHSDYHGRLEVRDGPGSGSTVELRLEVDPPPEVARRMQERHGNVGHAMRIAVERTLGSIKACCEGAAGAEPSNKDTARSAEDLPDSRPFGSSATLNPDI